jgi:hypothetical protein
MRSGCVGSVCAAEAIGLGVEEIVEGLFDGIADEVVEVLWNRS